ncbi:hypothetical protein ASPZODRAFT_17627 [Penicilliopsis zonata CBS 506.65]|uniref:Uncharacterized protein n=1 Tax=Penicilliopsis zonata CBS 506.65 TaxID=1073090 RepID=A0A1L9SE08_9EURO|nr:hypothetical protein ASPZODRAFT_17627 [Penicilliopsis zonata CBS 506.65]OJJ45411.1 hypothetical protein ASPZODRAFT_17627 [Penicilliopsis zonata CBS 506.65]
MMPAASSGSRGKPVKRVKSGTETTKSHRFEPFTQRIAKLKIDPIHRVRRPSFGEDADETSSHFRSAYDHWVELNLSENFVAFARRVNPLSESLAQILYHEEKIMALLMEFIEKRDPLCMEPLLTLLAQFARDLGVRFERHFAAAVTLVASVAATHSDVEVVEWSFTCLAWIFKFLSRLLVPDLTQLLGIMTPYLGKEKQKTFVARFAAESMSFLIRKAALVYHKNKVPLERAVSFLLRDLRETADVKDVHLYKAGLMAMFSDAMRGIKGALHSNATDILGCLLASAPSDDGQQFDLAVEVVSGIIINTIHNTPATTFAPILESTRHYIESQTKKAKKQQIELGCRLMFVIIGTRKGTRVRDWKTVHETLLLLLRKAATAIEAFDRALPQLLTTIAYALQVSPMDEMLPFMRPIMDAVANDKFSSHFLSFCATFSEWGSERFHNVVLPYFQKFINASWEQNEYGICLTLLRLNQAGCISSEPTKPGYITCPPTWKSHIKSRLSATPGSGPAEIALINAYSKLPQALALHTDPSLIPDLVRHLHEQLLVAFKSEESLSDSSKVFFHGQGFKTYVELAVQSGDLDTTLWGSITLAAANYSRLPLFLDGVLTYISACTEGINIQESSIEEFANSLITNLAGPSHQSRLLSLKILRELIVRVHKEDPEPVDLAIEVEESPLTLQSHRTLAMHVRKLAILYPQVSSRKWMATLIPHFCFGLFSKKMTPLWDDAAAALKSISEHTAGEKLVSDMAIQWLQETSTGLANDETADNNSNNYVSGYFECFNLAKVEDIQSTFFQSGNDPATTLTQDFEKEHTFTQILPASPRTQALCVLNAAPAIAEKRSRQIVPLFLSWALREDEDDSTDLKDGTHVTWGFRDRMAMLTLFGQFINPKVLFKAPEVHEALLGLLSHGNSEMQKHALKAIFTWKSASISPYQENLLNILDESRFRDELAVFVHTGREDSVIEEGHKAELLPVLLRLLYGRMISKAGSNAGQAGQTGRRKAILRTLSLLSDEDFELFMQISLGPFANIRLVQDAKLVEQCFSQEIASPRRQTGMLKLIETVFETLKTRMLPYAQQAMDATVYCLVRACRAIEKAQSAESSDHQDDKMLNILKSVRQSSIHCLDLIFSISPGQDWTPYLQTIFTEAIDPRMENFAIETAQGISGLLRLFHTWASAPSSSFYLVRFNKALLTKVTDCLGVESARDEVKIFVMDEILVPIVGLASGKRLQEQEEMADFSAEEIRTEVLSPYVEHILFHLSRLLKRGPSRPLLVSGVETLSLVAPCVESSQETFSLISITTYLLRQPADRVSPKTKSGLLRILEHFLPLYDTSADVSLTEQVFDAVSSMFDYFRDEVNREVLSRVFTAFAKHDSKLVEPASLCEDLNSRSVKKLGLDYERRLQAFRKINEGLWEGFSAQQWRPLLYNMLYHVKDEEELAIRSSASFGLRRFMERAVLPTANDSEDFESLVQDVLFPALQQGMRQKSELIRVEFVTVLGYFVKINPTRVAIQDMHVLLVGDDEEASFFTNVLHIQQHRRLRALRRLASEASQGRLQASNISNIFIPLIEHFVFDQEADESAHNLVAEAVNTIGSLGEWLDWNQFRNTFRRYRGYMQSKPDLEKNVIRLLGKMSDALSNAMVKFKASSGADAAGDGEDAMEVVETDAPTESTLAKSIPSTEKVVKELTSHFIPFLTEFIHHKEESAMSLRLPAAVTTVKLLKLLPEDEMGIRLQPVLLDVCSVLKSRVQETRDTARKTLSDIAIILGPGYFSYILKELRNTLARGYQLHVLSFTVHSILVATTDDFKQGDLDYCLADLTAVVMDDIFGATGQEKDAEEYVSKMKEVKSSKSYDSMELLAKNATVRYLSHLIRPLQALLREKLTSNIIKKADELLRRIGIGLLRNPGAESRDLLVFCYEVIKESYQDPNNAEAQTKLTAAEERFLIKLRGPKRGQSRGSTTSYAYKLTRFSLDVLRSILNKFDSLLTANNVAGFLPIIGDSMVQALEEVKISALRLLSTIIKLPLAEIDNNSHVYLTEAVKMIKEAPSTNTEGAQASLKLIAAMIRERKSTQLRDGHLAYLLKRLASDIEEPDRQGVTFNFIRAVMARKFVVPEMYELADNIAAMMVTNQTRSARDLARGVYIHFLIEYPQAKNRWTKQLSFLAKNLEYKHPEGRQSVMEALHMLLAKTGPELAQDIVGTFFLPIVLVMANDDAPECREMAGALLGELYNRADKEQMKTVLRPLHSWLEQTDNMLLCRTGLQAMRIYFEAEGTEKEKEARFVIGVLPQLMKPLLKDQENEDWETLYFSLQLFTRLCRSMSSIALSKECEGIWADILESLFYPHAWVKTCAANLVGMWLADLAKSNAAQGYGSLPLAGAAGLELDRDSMIQLIRASVRCLRTPGVSEELAVQTIRNIVFLGRCCAQNDLQFSKAGADDTAQDSDLDESDSDDEDKQETVNEEADSLSKPATQYIFEQISSILRREIISTRAETLIPKTASMTLLAALCRHLETDQIRPSLPVILLPLLHFTDASIPPPRSSDEAFQNGYKALVSNSHEVLDLIQKKLGTTEYVTQMTLVNDAIKERREGRRVKRRIEAVADPERYGRDKKRRNDRKREKRKEKGMEHRGKRRGW